LRLSEFMERYIEKAYRKDYVNTDREFHVKTLDALLL